MRHLLAGLLLLAACYDAGPRDRSLLPPEEPPAPQPAAEPEPLDVPREKHSPAVAGLIPDPISHLYPADAELVLRLDDISTFEREVRPHLEAVNTLLAGRELPLEAPAIRIARRAGLPEDIEIDPLRPCALVRFDGKWAALLPTEQLDAEGRARKLDPSYSVVGAPDVVAEYEPGLVRGYYLPGNVSVLAAPRVLDEFGGAFAALPLAAGAERLDASLRFGTFGVRADVRVAMAEGGAAAIEGLSPSASRAVSLLPPAGTVYVELPVPSERALSAACAWLGADADAGALAALAALARDAAAVLRLAPDGTGSLVVTAVVEDPQAARAYLASNAPQALLDALAGGEGVLAWNPAEFERNGVAVSSVTGSFAKSRLEAWADGPLAPLATLLKDGFLVHAGVVEDVLFVVAGARSRPDAERYIDQLMSGGDAPREHAEEGGAIFEQRLFAATFDLAGLFDGLRPAFPAWHEKGEALSKVELRWRLPAALAVTIEGSAVRAAVRVPVRPAVEALAKVLAALNPPPPPEDAASPAGG